MIEPDMLADRLQDLATLLRSQGGVTWERVDAWTKANMPRLFEEADDDQEERARAGRSEEYEENRRLDAAAARYKGELSTLTERLRADLARLTTILSVCNPATPKRLANRDLLAAQVAADGWCISCWRDDQFLEPIAEGRYRDRCRACGDWKGEMGQDPPVAVLVLRHTGRRLTTAAVAAALAR